MSDQAERDRAARAARIEDDAAYWVAFAAERAAKAAERAAAPGRVHLYLPPGLLADFAAAPRGRSAYMAATLRRAAAERDAALARLQADGWSTEQVEEVARAAHLGGRSWRSGYGPAVTEAIRVIGRHLADGWRVPRST